MERDMSAVIRYEGVAGPFPTDQHLIGQYLRSCDFEYDRGRGYVTFTPDIDKAMKFTSKAEALEYWRTRSKTVPTRPDGKPNRPLTAYHVMIEDIA
jgi:hypothetical protein